MKNILMLALAPIRKNKGQSVSLFVFALITAMFLNIGLVLFFGIGSFYDERAEINHAAHFTGAYYSDAESLEQGQAFIENDSRVVEMEKIHAIGSMGEYVINDAKAFNGIIFSRYNETQKMDAPSFIGDTLQLSGNRIYVPNYIYLNGKFAVGDNFTLFLSGVELNFTIAGVTEEMMFGTQLISAFRFYIPDEKFDELEKQFPDSSITLLSARFYNAADATLFQSDYNKDVSADGLFLSLDYNISKQVRTMIPTIIAIVITVFSIILLAVCLIVIRFRIVNGIEESMTNIGAQKAIGYRNIQIITANVMQYGLVALAGGLIGAIIAGAVLPIISKIFEPLWALGWNPGFDISTATMSILLVLLTVTLITFMTSRKIRKLHPLTALRGGIATHSFRRNAFPLDKSHGVLNFLLALKQITQNKKQTITVSVIIAAITMASVAGIAINYNMNDGRETFARSMFGETSMANLVAVLRNGDDGEVFRERISKYTEVSKIIAYQSSSISLLVDEVKTSTLAAEDCSLMESPMLVEGYYPKHDNEIALGPSTLNAAGKKIGDTVTIRYGDNENDCIITGIIQLAEANGFTGLLTAEGMREIIPDFKITTFNVCLNDGVDTEAFIKRLQESETEILDNIINVQEQMAVSLDSMGGMFAAVAYGIIAVTVFVVVLTLYMVIKTTILRRKRELGIQKAVGFTTLQLMNQIALNMTPVILLGVLAGTVAGCLGFNPLMSALTSGMGMAKLILPIPFDQIIVACIALVILAYAVSMLIAWRIRKISAYSLVSE